MRDSGKMISNMALEFKVGQTEVNMKVNLKKVRKLVKVDINGAMVQIMKENGKII